MTDAIAHQVPRPHGLDLPDEAVIGGKTVTGARARVYHLLRITRERRLAWPVGLHTGPAGWVPTYVLREPWAGGQAGDRRLRELRRRYGCQIAQERFEDPDTGQITETWLWRLDAEPSATPAPRRESPAPSAPAHPPTPEAATVGAATPPPASPTPAPPAHPLPLCRLRVWLVHGHPGDLGKDVQASATWEVTPGASCWLAPSEDLVRALHEAAHAARVLKTAQERYREELLHHYRNGRLVRELGGHRAMILWSAEDLYDPLPMLAHALERLGATITWQETSA